MSVAPKGEKSAREPEGSPWFLSEDLHRRAAAQDARERGDARACSPVNAKFDVDVVEWFRSQGRGYQARMDAVLRRSMEARCKAG